MHGNRCLFENTFVRNLLNEQMFKFTTNINAKNICDPVCEKGSYSLFNCMYLATYNLTSECGITLTTFGPIIVLQLDVI